MGDPLADLVARGIGAPVVEASAEAVPGRPDLERIRYRTRDGAGTLVLRRLARELPLEAQLLPFLARKTPHVPAVRARGLPPPAARARPWLLLEDTIDAAPSCDDPVAVVRAKVEIEKAVERDGPALRALGVERRAGEAALASWPVVLVHGALTCKAARRADRIVMSDWDHAFLGCGLVDVVSLADSAGADPIALAREYAGRDVRPAEIDAARLVAERPAPYN